MLTLPDFECELLQAKKRARDQFISPGQANGADALEEPSDVPEYHGSEAEFRNQETCTAERCVFHGVLLFFCQAHDDLARLEEGFPFLFIQLCNGLRQPCKLCILGALPHGRSEERRVEERVSPRV